MSIILERWHDNLGESRYLALDSDTFQIANLSPSHPAGDPVSGWFAFYENHFFCVFAKKMAADTAEFMLVCEDKYLPLDSDMKIEWQSTIYGRIFKMVRGDAQIVTFRYRSPWQYLMHPVKFFRDVVFASDWWGLTSDLPSFVHSSIAQGSGLTKALRDWNSKRAVTAC